MTPSDHFPRDARAVIADDPLKDLEIGAVLTCRPVTFWSDDAGAEPLDAANWGASDGAILAVGIRHADGSSTIEGSATMVAPGVCVTATHVFSEHMPKLERGTVGLFFIGIRADHTMDVWTASRISHHADDDISFVSIGLRSAMPSGWFVPVVPISTRAPRDDEVVGVFGFRFVKVTPRTDGNEGFVAAGDLFAARGAVRAVRPYGRDRVMVPFASIEIDCGALPAMSGGAVVDDRGHLIGVTSSSLASSNGEHGPVNAGWLAPALGRQLEVPWPPGLQPADVRAVNLVGALVECPEAVAVDNDGMTRVHPWFDRDDQVDLS